MILQALCDYYKRKPDLPRLGFETKAIPFVIEINAAGQLVQIEDTRTIEGKKKIARNFIVPQGLKKSSGVAANLLWGNAEYVLGISNEGDPKKVKERHTAFQAKLDTISAQADIGLAAVRSFLKSPDRAGLEANPHWQEILNIKPDMTFRLQGDLELICQRPVIRAVLGNASAKEITCLVSGEPDEISDANGKPDGLHWSIPGVWGAQSSGANIVSFNKDAFNSFGKVKGANAPVGKRVAFAYTTALKYLLGKESTQRIQVGDTSTVFWSEVHTEFEDSFADFLNEPSKDNPARRTRAIEALFKAPHTGVLSDEGGNKRFYVLGLAPNAARISIRFWHVGTVAEMSAQIRQYFEDTEIVHANYEKPYLSLFRLLVATASLGKSENIPPNLAGEFMRAILTGQPYPQTLLQAAVRRIRAEQSKKDERTGKPVPNVNYPRAALIKACINRNAKKEELKVSLDESNTNHAYRLGRLFAALERVQERANPSINTTIRERFYGAASGTPVTVFPTLLKLKNHHIAKLSKGEAVNQEKLISAIIDGVTEFPAQLSLQDQGRFAIGYYHQRQAFFTKS
ncbi:MAG: type I-C CRISPR-associated protein Cas8c/Csd1 [Candidatus Nitrotoga sp.]